MAAWEEDDYLEAAKARPRTPRTNRKNYGTLRSLRLASKEGLNTAAFPGFSNILSQHLTGSRRNRKRAMMMGELEEAAKERREKIARMGRDIVTDPYRKMNAVREKRRLLNLNRAKTLKAIRNRGSPKTQRSRQRGGSCPCAAFQRISQ